MARYRIAEAREKKHMTQAQLAAAIGSSQQQVARWESGNGDVKASVIVKLSAALGVTISYLLGLSDDDADDSDFEEVPLYGHIAAGTPLEMLEVDDMKPAPAAIRAKYPRAFFLEIRGESMNRILPNGCYALVDPCSEVTADMAPYAVCVNGYAATVKRVRKLAHGFQLVPDSTDPTYRPKTYDYNDPSTETITIIGRVVYYMLPFDWSF